MFDLTLNPPSLSEAGEYTIHYLVTETGIGFCTFIPHIRQYVFTVNKRPPQINYDIPDYTIRAGIPYEIKFPVDP